MSKQLRPDDMKQMRASEDEDVEGHGMQAQRRVTEPEGIASPRTRIAEDEDVEGHRMKTARADEPEGEGLVKRARIEGDDEDVEGHVKQATRRAVDDEDVEGHGMPMRSPSSRGE